MILMMMEFFNPGETAQVKILVGMKKVGPMEKMLLQQYPQMMSRILILDDTIEFSNNIPTGGTAFTLIDHFLVQVDEDAQLGDVQCIIHLQAGTEPPYYKQILKLVYPFL